MGTFRGFCSSIGAATSLVIAGVLGLLAASSVVAFNGWPGVRDWPEADPVAVTQVVTTDSRRPGDQAVRLGAGSRSDGSRSGASARSGSASHASRSGATAGTRARAAPARRGPVARTGTPGRSLPRATPAGGSPAAPAAGEQAAKPSTADEVAQTVDGVTAPTRREPLRLRVPHVREAPALDPVVDSINGVLDRTTATLQELLSDGQRP